MTTGHDRIDDAVRAIHDGLVVAFPTDTVYGIAASALSPAGASKLAAAKGRSADIPVQVLVSGLEQASELGVLDDSASRVARRFWPGALTLVVPRRPGVELHLGGDGTTVGVRWPASEIAVELCSRCGPLVATSANIHGEKPLETADRVAAAFGDAVAVVLVGGRPGGLASTVVDLTGGTPLVLREGAVAIEDVEAALAG